MGTAGWEGAAYAPHAAHHRALDDWFLERHPPRPIDHVVDAGCGTGEFTARVAHLVPGGRVVGVEPDRSMLALALRRAGGNLSFRRGRLQELDAVCGKGTADLVLSRAVLHWIPLDEHLACYQAIRRVLRPGGWLHAESGGAGNVRPVAELMDRVAAEHGIRPAAVTFPDPGSALELLERSGFDIPRDGAVTVAQRRAFDRAGLAGFLRTQASMAYAAQGADEQEAFLADVLARLDDLRRHDGTYDQTFVRLVVRCRRPT